MYIFLTILTSFFSLIIQDQDIVSYKSSCVSMTDEGLVTLQIWDIDAGKKYKIEQAEKDAVAFILYEGFSGSKCGYISPLLKNYDAKYEFEDTHLYFFKKSGSCLNYKVSSKIPSSKPSSINQNWAVYEVVVNKKLLDEYLVQKEIKSKIDIY